MAQKKILASEEISVFLTQASLILQSGIPLADGIGALRDNFAGTRFDAPFSALCETLEQSGSLADATRASGMFPDYMIEMVAIGEQAGELDTVLASLSDYYDRDARLRRSIRNAVIYPIVLIAMMAVVILILVVKVLPIFERVFANMGVDMPSGALALMHVGMGAGKAVLIVSAVLILLALMIALLLKTRLRAKILPFLYARIPLLGRLYGKLVAGRFAQVMAMMLGSGFPIAAATGMTVSLFEDAATRAKMESVCADVNAGETLPDALEKASLFAPMPMRMIRVGYLAGQTDRVMKKLAAIYDEELNDGIMKLVAAIEPTLVALLSIIIGAILLSVMLPLVGIMSSIV